MFRIGRGCHNTRRSFDLSHIFKFIKMNLHFNSALRTTAVSVAIFLVVTVSTRAQNNSPVFSWPDGKQIAVSLTFDDARKSQGAASQPGSREQPHVTVSLLIFVLAAPEPTGTWLHHCLI